MLAPALLPGGVALQPSVLVGSYSLPADALVPGGVSLAPATVQVQLSVPAQGFALANQVTLATLAAALTAPAPSLAPGGVSLQPSSIAALWGFPAASMAPGGVSLGPSPVVGQLVLLVPDLLSGELIHPVTLAIQLQVLPEAVQAGPVTVDLQALAAQLAVPLQSLLSAGGVLGEPVRVDLSRLRQLELAARERDFEQPSRTRRLELGARDRDYEQSSRPRPLVLIPKDRRRE